MLVPALSVFCTPEKLNEMRGSSSLLKSLPLGMGNKISLTPIRVKPIPIFPKRADIQAPTVKPVRPNDRVVPPVAKANPINATPAKALPTPPAPLITGTILTSDSPIGSCI